jgi:hypothetical protein
MATSIFLGISTLVWLGYGLYCLFDPGYLAEAAAVAAGSATGTTEIRAMYGGLQAGVGVIALGGLLRENLVRPALFALAVLTTGLFVARLLGALIDASWTGYTIGALGFELASAVIARVLLVRS